jgi:hypothetical protein
MICCVDVIVQLPPTFHPAVLGIIVRLTAPSVVSAAGGEMLISDDAPAVANTCVHVGEPTIVVVLDVAPIDTPKLIVQPMLWLLASCADRAHCTVLVELIGRLRVLPAIRSCTVAPPELTAAVASALHADPGV